MIDLQERVGHGVARFLTQAPANLSCPPGTVGRDLDLDPANRESIREHWLRPLRAGAVIHGSGQGLLVTGGTAGARRHAAGALATTAVIAATQVFADYPLTGVPFRTFSATSYVEWLRDSYDAGAPDDLVRALKGNPEDRANHVLLAVLLELGAEPHIASSKFAQDQLRVLLSLRVERGLPTIVTTKHTSSAISGIYGQEMLDVLDEFFLPVKLGGGT